MRVAIISDTHMPRRGLTLPAVCLARLRAAGLIVHAGDHSDLESLRRLRAIGPPVVAVRGNVEDAGVRAALPATAEIELDGLVLGVTHDAGPAAGRLARLRRRFPRAGGVVFGHSHIPLHERAEDGFFILNPGSPTDRRRQPRHSMAELTVRNGAVTEVAFWSVDGAGGPLDPEEVRGTPLHTGQASP